MLGAMSLRRKLVLSILLLFAIVTVATSAATVAALQHSVIGQLDEQLQAGSRLRRDDDGPGQGQGQGRGGWGAAQAACEGVGGGRAAGGAFGRQALTVATTRSGNTVACVTRPGSVTALSADQIALVASADLDGTPKTVDLGGSLGSYRAVAGTDPAGNTVVSGLSSTEAQNTVTRLVTIMGLVGLSGIVLVVLGGSWLVRRNLAPLERVATIAGKVSRTPLSTGEVEIAERVPAADTDTRTEVGQVGAALNELLDHVDTSLRARHESETQLRRFVADASHELRTPLASIRGYAELSRRETEPVPEGVRHALTRIDSESARMASLVEDLLLLARLDAGRELAREPVDLTHLVIDAVSDARAAGPDHKWQLDLPEESVETVGDQARLTQVIVNLLGNARTHTPAGTTVVASVRRDANTAVLVVADDGPGIPPELLPRIFKRFTRGDEARTRPTGVNGTPTASTGLGLSIVDAVVAAHHGAVGVQSVPGRTVFTVRLPLATT
ncbi:MAG: HAMP domain-containing histidine kinase [Austwickia sp.]|nr:MAG: HAMP domain-containing histidine kinase [Austwickia sp.]